MLPLEDRYSHQLDTIASHIQASEILSQYLEEEDEELYKSLVQSFEPYISEAHHLVSAEAPLQLEAFEKRLLDPDFEGLYLPRVLGWSVLRGEISPNFKYVRPNDHFKNILLAICQSANFEQLKKRVGQTIQIGFMLSSDIWITSLLTALENKRIRYFLQSQKLDKYRDIKDREIGYTKYANQFKNEIYFSADFPTTAGEMHSGWSALRQFIIKRVEKGVDNTSLVSKIRAFITNPDFQKTDEHLEMLSLYANFFDLEGEEAAELKTVFNIVRREMPRFVEKFFNFQNELYKQGLPIGEATDRRVSAILDKKMGDKMTEFYMLADEIHTKGYVTPEVIDAVRTYYLSHEGLSPENESVRHLILQYFLQVINNLRMTEYGDYFEMWKIFSLYMQLFSNQLFNQSIEKASMKYVANLMKRFVDKRSRDYQDIKKFVSYNFVEFGFLDDKEVVEMFKTRRKRKAA
jgi:hypothetical protein